MMMKRLEAKYAALQVVPVIAKLGTAKVGKYMTFVKYSPSNKATQFAMTVWSH